MAEVDRESAENNAEIGLQFCKLCLGWKDTKVERKRIFHFDEILSWVSLDPKSLQDVMRAVQVWLSSMDAYYVESNFEELFNFNFGSYFVGAVDEADICRELLEACIEAAGTLPPTPAPKSKKKSRTNHLVENP
jgi:hypothetical protein